MSSKQDARADWSLQSEPLADYRIFRVLRKRGASPRTGQPVVFHALEMRDWVQIIARTRSGQFILVEQFRPGAEINSLEFPAGIIEDGEDPQQAGLRELEEETGYQGRAATLLGSIFPNPAIQSNRLHIVLTEDCEPTGSTQQDESEDLHMRLAEEQAVRSLMLSGAINHALDLAAWQLYELWRVQREASRT